MSGDFDIQSKSSLIFLIEIVVDEDRICNSQKHHYEKDYTRVMAAFAILDYISIETLSAVNAAIDKVHIDSFFVMGD